MLNQKFEHVEFRPGQLEVILETVKGNDVNLCFQTNFGKSLCYQLPALYQNGRHCGTTVVIEPTKALIE